MATLAYGLLASVNNALCDPGLKGFVTLPFMPILASINPIVITLIVITAFFIRYTGGTNFQNFDGNEKTFSRSFLFALLWWYIGLFIVFVLYKIFGCSRTVGRSKAYAELSNLSNLSSKSGSLVENVFKIFGNK